MACPRRANALQLINRLRLVWWQTAQVRHDPTPPQPLRHRARRPAATEEIAAKSPSLLPLMMR
jgi:hypothetical protein